MSNVADELARIESEVEVAKAHLASARDHRRYADPQELPFIADEIDYWTLTIASLQEQGDALAGR